MKSWQQIKVYRDDFFSKKNCNVAIFFFIIDLSKASRGVAETLKTFKFYIVGSKQTDEERDIGLCENE